MLEFISKPAVQVDGQRVFVGDCHASALEAAQPDASLDQLNDQGIDGIVAGFVTSTGRFVSRSEAYVIATAAGQSPITYSLAEPYDLWSGCYESKEKE